MLLTSVIPTHTVADWLLKTIDGALNHMGLSHYEHIEEIIYILILSLISIGIGILLKKLILLITKKIIAVKKNDIATELHNHKVFLRCSHIIPPLVFMALIPFAFNSGSVQLHWIMKCVGIYTLIAFAIGVTSVIEFIFDRYNEKENRKNLPLKGVRNIAIGVLWIIIVILSVAVLLDKSPAALLAGLGAFAAALMLIFKDSILGFVAGIQMSDNDMIRVGDWIVVPGTPANGIVQDVSLSTVKILNWDLTTVMVPPYTLVSSSVQNYRSMYAMNVRRIENSFIIDNRTVKPLTEDNVNAIVAKYPDLKPFVDSLHAGNVTSVSNQGMRALNGTIETNLGLFRAYAAVYLGANPQIAKDHRVMVRVMQGTNAGTPLQIWCFTATTNWDQYEGIQSTVMEHLTAAISDFDGLAIYSGTSVDINNSGYSDKTP